MTTLLPLSSTCKREHGTWWNPSSRFCDELAVYLKGRRVLEIFAGNGYLAGQLAARGVDVTATSVLSSHDGHDRGFYHPVEDLSAVSAVLKYSTQADVLLICWPVVTQAVLQAAVRWGSDREIIYMGEVTDHTHPLGLAGCASDEFFEAVKEHHRFSTYKPKNFMDRAMACRLL